MRKKFVKIISSLLILTMLLTSCFKRNKDEEINEKMSLGIGVYTELNNTNATLEKEGKVEIVYTVAALVTDKDGKIADCKFDTQECYFSVSADGKYNSSNDFKSKRELGDSYVMSTDSAKLKWYEQADAYAKVLKGKTLEEAKATVMENGKGNNDVINTGCTITVSDFYYALEKAFSQKKEFLRNSKETLGIGIYTNISGKNADGGEGKAEIDSSFSVVSKYDGKVVSEQSDAIDITIKFDSEGKMLSDSDVKYQTKRELGDNYGMTASGIDNNGDGKMLEWYLQANAFDNATVGLDKSKIAALNIDGYASDSLQTAGCTIKIDGLTKAALKALSDENKK